MRVDMALAKELREVDLAEEDGDGMHKMISQLARSRHYNKPTALFARSPPILTHGMLHLK